MKVNFNTVIYKGSIEEVGRNALVQRLGDLANWDSGEGCKSTFHEPSLPAANDLKNSNSN